MIKLFISDFDGVFTNNKVLINQFGQETVLCDRADGIGINKLLTTGVDFIVCSSEENPCAKHRAEKIGFEAFLGIKDKGKFVKDYLLKAKLKKSQVAFLGNDINDLPAFKEVGYSIAVVDAFPEVLSKADFILKSDGGNAAVREACELIIKINREQ